MAKNLRRDSRSGRVSPVHREQLDEGPNFVESTIDWAKRLELAKTIADSQRRQERDNTQNPADDDSLSSLGSADATK